MHGTGVCLETERTISNDWVVRYENRYFQLERSSDYPPRQAKVVVCEWEDGRIEIRYRGKAQAHREMAALADPDGREASAAPDSLEAAANHPWRRRDAAATMLRATASAAP